MADYKTVLMEIRVPTGEYCMHDEARCNYFSHVNGSYICDLRFGIGCDDSDRHNVRPVKSSKCAKLKEVMPDA